MDLSKLNSKAGIGILALIIGGLIGYTIMPKKVVTKTEVKEVVKEVEKTQTDVNKNKKNDRTVIKIETILPDGTKKIETRIVDKGTITIDSSSSSESSKESTKEATTEKTVDRSSQTLIYGLGSVDAGNPSAGPDYGIGVQKQILGPVWGGAFGTKNGNVGITIGIGL